MIKTPTIVVFFNQKRVKTSSKKKLTVKTDLKVKSFHLLENSSFLRMLENFFRKPRSQFISSGRFTKIAKILLSSSHSLLLFKILRVKNNRPSPLLKFLLLFENPQHFRKSLASLTPFTSSKAFHLFNYSETALLSDPSILRKNPLKPFVA